MFHSEGNFPQKNIYLIKENFNSQGNFSKNFFSANKDQRFSDTKSFRSI